MKKILVTGGTVFVSRFIANFFVQKGYEVYVMNRNTRQQVEGVHLIECDRKHIGNKLMNCEFDIIIDVNAYTREDIKNLLDAVHGFKKYIFISSSAVYGIHQKPISEKEQCKYNPIWKEYGTNKREAEEYLLSKVPEAYILRPPYLYGPMENLYRAAFVFECAERKRKFYLPGEGKMKLQFFYVGDLCKFIEILMDGEIEEHIFNVGNSETVTIKQWVEICYQVVGEKEVDFVNLYEEKNQRDFFCFYDYEYQLDVSLQNKYFKEELTRLSDGLAESYKWYAANKEEIQRKEYIRYLDENYTK